ncbi:MAG: hypothetical protein RL145_567 [Pseudomonadota bacterium]|jgi:hypothetical protein
MSLFDEGTVIIVGAGASVPFGLPTGIGMFDEMVALLEKEINQAKTSGCRDMAETPFLATIATDAKIVGLSRDSLELAKQLLENLKSQTSDTIDDFIVQNENQAQLCKALIAWTLLWCVVDPGGDESRAMADCFGRELYPRKPKTQGRTKSEASDQNHVPRRNWLHQIINIARDQYDSKIPGSKVKVISFNYDTILEQILSAQWNNVQRDYGDWKDSFEILHPHGAIPFPAIGEKKVDVRGLILEGANNICVAREQTVPKSIEVDRERAKEIMNRSEKVFAIGFAFSRSNCELIGIIGKFFKFYTPNSLYRFINFINFDGSFGLRARVQAYCTSNVTENFNEQGMPLEFKPELGGKMHIDQALIAGFLGEMPS